MGRGVGRVLRGALRPPPARVRVLLLKRLALRPVSVVGLLYAALGAGGCALWWSVQAPQALLQAPHQARQRVRLLAGRQADRLGVVGCDRGGVGDGDGQRGDDPARPPRLRAFRSLLPRRIAAGIHVRGSHRAGVGREAGAGFAGHRRARLPRQPDQLLPGRAPPRVRVGRPDGTRLGHGGWPSGGPHRRDGQLLHVRGVLPCGEPGGGGAVGLHRGPVGHPGGRRPSGAARPYPRCEHGAREPQGGHDRVGGGRWDRSRVVRHGTGPVYNGGPPGRR
mmetsp:Transcript_8463/g.23873  ORF Transcript_8463/g.23873 Transcript_8463/m.23873 type:complete len:278 (+) Transcript_8463:2452-3285(+)